MEFFKPGRIYDFMKIRHINIIGSFILFFLAIGLYFFPGPNYGIDFKGGTEIQVAFAKTVNAAELRGTLERAGYHGSDVVNVEGRSNEYLLRVPQASSMSADQKNKIFQRLRRGIDNAGVVRTKFSPGGDKISIWLGRNVEPENVRTALVEAGAEVRDVTRFGQRDQHRYEVRLIGVADEVMESLRQAMADKDPSVQRVEWVGAKAGEQLRNSALMSLLYAVAFIMLYVAFRFDLRFAPGGVVAMVHDAVITAGVLILLQREITLTTVAALLTIVGYSINDTIVVYDRIRENMQKMRGRSLFDIINYSISQTLSRTTLTSLTTLISISAFFLWGTPVIRDFALTMTIGIVIGTYSSIYVAAPITEYLDKRFFRRAAQALSEPRRAR